MKKWCFILLFMMANVAISQSTGDTSMHHFEHIDSSHYHTLVKEVTYEKTKDKLLPREFEQKKKKKKKKSEKENVDTIDFSFLEGSLVKVLMYVFIGALVLLVIWLLLSNIKLSGKEKLKTLAPSDDEIEDIEEVDADAGYMLSLENKDYRLACRMIFLKVLQTLQQKELIRWKKDKTNRHYLREMSGHDHESAFGNLVLEYEKVWYGDKGITKDALISYAQKASTITPIKIPSYEQ